MISTHGRTRTSATALALAMSMLAAACFSAPRAPAASADPARQVATRTHTQGGALSVGLNTRIATLDPNRQSSAQEGALAHQIYDYLVAVDVQEPRITPWLTESWSVSSDGLIYTFKLRPGVKFQDGTPFNASAAKQNFERLSVAAVSGVVRDIATNLARASAPDDTTLVVEMKSPAVAFLNDLGTVPMLSPAAFQQWGDDYGQHPVGSGAFRLKAWVPEDHLVLERNPDYAWPPANSTNPGPAYLDSVTFKIIADPPARLVSFESGDTQMAMYVPNQDVTRLAADKRYKLATRSTAGVPLTFFMNVSAGPLSDLQVRVAIESALDRTQLIQVGGYGQPVPAAGLLASTTACFSPNFGSLFPYDPAHARQLLDADGWVSGPDGVRQKDGKALAFEMVHYPDYANLAATIQAQLKDIGIQLTLKMMDQSAGSALIRTGQASTFLVAGVASDPGVLSSGFRSGVGSTWSAAIVPDRETDMLLDRAAKEPDSTGKCQLYDQFQQRFLEAATVYPVWEINAPVAMRSNVQGVRLVPSAPNMPMFQEVYLEP